MTALLQKIGYKLQHEKSSVKVQLEEQLFNAHRSLSREQELLARQNMAISILVNGLKAAQTAHLGAEALHVRLGEQLSTVSAEFAQSFSLVAPKLAQLSEGFHEDILEKQKIASRVEEKIEAAIDEAKDTGECIKRRITEIEQARQALWQFGLLEPVWNPAVAHQKQYPIQPMQPKSLAYRAAPVNRSRRG